MRVAKCACRIEAVMLRADSQLRVCPLSLACNFCNHDCLFQALATLYIIMVCKGLCLEMFVYVYTYVCVPGRYNS